MSEPIVFTTEIQDKGALAFLKQLEDAMGKLSAAQKNLSSAVVPSTDPTGKAVAVTEEQTAALVQARAAYDGAFAGLNTLIAANERYAAAVGGVEALQAQAIAAVESGSAADAQAVVERTQLAIATERLAAASAAAALQAKGLADAEKAAAALNIGLGGSLGRGTPAGITNDAGAGLVVVDAERIATAQQIFARSGLQAVAVTQEEADALAALRQQQVASVAETGALTTVTAAETRTVLSGVLAIEDEAAALARRTIAQTAARAAMERLANAPRELAANATPQSQSGARALTAAGIPAQAPGIVNNEGIGLVTVAQRNQAAAQELLNTLGIEAVAVTKAQAAATFIQVEAANAAAAADRVQAEEATRLAVAEEAAATAKRDAAAAGSATPIAGAAAPVAGADLVAPTQEAAAAQTELATAEGAVATAAAASLAAINPLIEAQLRLDEASTAGATAADALALAQKSRAESTAANVVSIDQQIEAQLADDEAMAASAAATLANVDAMLAHSAAAKADAEAIAALADSTFAQELATVQGGAAINAMIEAQLRQEQSTIGLDSAYNAVVASINELTAASEREAVAAVNAANAQKQQAASAAQLVAAQRAAAVNLANGQALSAAAARAAASAAQQAAPAVASLNQQASESGPAFGGMWLSILKVVAALEALKAIKDAISTGIDFNATIETASLGIAASVQALATIRDSQGKVLEGNAAFAESSRLADEQIEKLFGDAARTSTTMERLITSFQQVTGAGLSAGASLDQIRKLTVDATLAAGALNVPYHQVGLTLVQLLEGHAQVRNRLTAILGITQEQVKNWKEQGTLVDNLLDRFGKFDALGVKVQGTFRGIKSEIVDFFQQFTGAASHGAFTALETGLIASLQRVFDFKSGKILGNLAGLQDAFSSVLGGVANVVTSAIDSTVSGAIRLSTFLTENKVEVQEIGKAFFEMGKQLFGILGDISEIVVAVIKWGVESGTIRGVFDFIADAARIVRGALALLVGQVGDLKGGFEAATPAAEALGAVLALIGLANPWLLAIGAVIALGVEVERLLHQHDLEIAKLKSLRDQYGQNNASLIRLSREYGDLQAAIDSHKLSVDGVSDAVKRQQELFDQMVKLGLNDAAVTARMNREHTDLATAIKEETQARIDNLRALALAATDELLKAEDARDSFVKNSTLIGDAARQKLVKDPFAELTSSEAPAIFRDRLRGLNNDVLAATTNFGTLTNAVKTMDAEIAKPVHLGTATGNRTDTDPNAGKEFADAKRVAQAAIEEAENQFREADALLQQRLKEHQISIGQYFEQLRGLHAQMFQKEAEAQSALLANAVQFGVPQGEIDKIQADLNKIRSREAAARAKDRTDEEAARRALADKISEMEIQVLEATGNKQQAELIRSQRKYAETVKQFDAEIAGGGIGEAAGRHGKELAKHLYDIEAAKIRLEGLKEIIRQGDDELTAGIQEIRDAQDAGHLTESAANQLVLNQYNARKRALEALLAAQIAINTEAQLQTGVVDPNAAKSIDTITEALNRLGPELARAERATHQLHEAIKGAATNVLEEFFANTVRQAKSFGDAMRQLALNVIDAINAIVSKIIASKIIEALFSIGSGLGGSPDTSAFDSGLDTSTPGIQGVGGLKFATGGVVAGPDVQALRRAVAQQQRFALGGFHGPVTGPATPIDAIPIWVTGGEYVINPKAVRQFGKAYFDEINFGHSMPEPVRRRTRRYAEGGIVAPIGGAGGEHSTHGFRGEIGLDPGLLWKHLDTPEGHKVFINVARKNAKMLRSVVGH